MRRIEQGDVLRFLSVFMKIGQHARRGDVRKKRMKESL